MVGPERGQSRPAHVCVVYAAPQRQETVHVEIAPGMNVAEAVARSGLSSRFPELTQRPLTCAIYGQIAPLTREVRDGDRIEILRPLLIDPKENRRQAAVRAKARAKSIDG